MADTKISALAANSTLDFTEVVPIVQSSTTKKMALSALSGRLFAKSAGLWYPLAASAVGVSGAADTNENTLATVTIPAGAMGANGRLRITTLWSITSSGNNKTLRIRLGGIAGTAFFSIALTTSASSADQREICNRSAQNSQIGKSTGSTPWGGTANAVTSGAIDTSAAVDLVITGQKAAAGETLTLESYLVELLYAA